MCTAKLLIKRAGGAINQRCFLSPRQQGFMRYGDMCKSGRELLLLFNVQIHARREAAQPL
jgi:hypothetical protein